MWLLVYGCAAICNYMAYCSGILMILIYILLTIIFVLVFGFLVIARRNLSKVQKLFKKGNVSVSGLRGRGKDMLIANVIARDNRPYISNVDYNSKKNTWIPLDMSKLDIKNSYKNFIAGNINEYRYPYPEGVDIYISDVGIYFPSQYNGELNREFKHFPAFMALSRQIADCNVHINSQALNRPWDKLREQSDIYILCNSCFYFGKNKLISRIPFVSRFVLQRVTVYNQYNAANDGVEPYEHIKTPVSISGKVRAEYKARDRAALREFRENHGSIRRYWLFYRNISSYDTRYFKWFLRGKTK